MVRGAWRRASSTLRVPRVAQVAGPTGARVSGRVVASTAVAAVLLALVGGSPGAWPGVGPDAPVAVAAPGAGTAAGGPAQGSATPRGAAPAVEGAPGTGPADVTGAGAAHGIGGTAAGPVGDGLGDRIGDAVGAGGGGSGSGPAPAPPGAPALEPPPDPSPGPAPGRVTGTVEHLWSHLAAPATTTTTTTATSASTATGATTTATSASTATGVTTTAPMPAAVQHTWLTVGEQRYRLAPGPLDDAVSGSRVTADLAAPEGGRYPVTAVGGVVPPEPAILDGIAVGSGATLDFGLLPAAVTHQVTVVLATPPGAARDSTTATAFRSTVAGPVASFWHSQSRGQRSVVVSAAHTWVSLSTPCSNPWGLWDEVAAKVGWTPGTRKHLLVYLPPAAGCGAGLGTVGPTSESGGKMWTSYDSADIVAHELGHNLGLGHSQGLLCPSTADGTFGGSWSAGCEVHGYRDWYDVMGISWGRLGSLAAPHADRLSLLPSTARVTVTAPLRVRLTPMAGDGLRVARIDDTGGTYYVEYRTAAGQDAWLTGNWRGLDAGVLVRRVNPANTRESLLLDGSVTAGTRTNDWRSAVGVGQSLVTASGRYRIRVDSADATGATVSFVVNGQEPGASPTLPNGTAVVFGNPATATVDPGSHVFWGTATAPEGTVLWEVRQGATVRASGFTGAGPNGTPGPFLFAVSLPSGTYTVRVRVPDESGGEAAAGTGVSGPGFSAEVTLTVR